MVRTSQGNPLDSLDLDMFLVEDDDAFDFDDPAFVDDSLVVVPQQQQQAEPPPTHKNSKKRKAKQQQDEPLSQQSQQPPTTHKNRKTNTMMVAPAGRFGQRPAAAATTPTTSTPTTTPTSMPRKKSNNNNDNNNNLTNHTQFCGIQPSSQRFYPFLPALPNEPSIKHRKKYGTLEKINAFLSTAFTTTNNNNNHNHTTNNNHNTTNNNNIHRLITQLVQEDPKMPSSITPAQIQQALQQTQQHMQSPQFFNLPLLLQDLTQTAALVQRQHNFLLQNAANMQLWAASFFNTNDYSNIYNTNSTTTSSSNSTFNTSRNVLASFPSRDIRVKIKTLLYNNHNTTTSVLPATLPSNFPLQGHATELQNKKGDKKKKTNSKKTHRNTTTTTTTHPLSMDDKPPPGSDPPTTINNSSSSTTEYRLMNPTQKRNHLIQLLSKVALKLEQQHSKHPSSYTSTALYNNNNNNSIPTKDKDSKPLDPKNTPSTTTTTTNTTLPPLNTTEMWKWFQDSTTYFQDPTVLDLQQLPPSHATTTTPRQEPQPQSNPSWMDRVQGLLVEESTSSCCSTRSSSSSSSCNSDTDDDEDFMDTDDESSFQDNGMISTSSHNNNLDSIMKKQLEKVGLVKMTVVPTTPLMATTSSSTTTTTTEWNTEIDLVTNAMMEDLIQIDERNEKRVNFLKQVVPVVSMEEKKRKKEMENSLIAKCQQVMKKSKEKNKNGKKGGASSGADGVALPW